LDRAGKMPALPITAIAGERCVPLRPWSSRANVGAAAP